ncbi:MAG TPA: SH3 domain-containing protein [Aggregatilineaceae bacterium]|nr:SH3 domain-containing protein [Aggregatilineaceae bacterium]
MRRLLLTLLLVLLVFHTTAAAAPPADGWLIYGLKVRTGPALTYAPLAALPPGTSLWFEAQNEDGTWLLAHAEDGTRGWVSVAFLA